MRLPIARIVLVAGILATLACQDSSGPALTLDQQNLLDGDLGGQGIGRFDDISGDPDPGGTSFDLQDAQTFTVGIAGTLSQVRVALFNAFGATGPATLEIRTTTGGVPDTSIAGLLATASVAASAVPVDSAGPVAWARFDVTSAGIHVTVGEMLAFVVRTADTNGYLLQPEETLGYADGTGYRRNRATTSVWAAQSWDVGFQTYVRR